MLRGRIAEHFRRCLGRKKNEVCPAGCHRPGAEPWPKPGWQRRLSLTCLPRRVRELLRTSRTSPLPPAARWTELRLALTSFLLHCIRSRAPRERRDHWLRLHRGLASSTPSFHRHTDCAWRRANDNRGSLSRSPRTNTRVSPYATVRLLLQHVTRRRLLPLHCRITSCLRSPYATHFPIAPLRVPASHPSTSMSTPGSSSPTPPLVEVHSQPFGARYLLFHLCSLFRSTDPPPFPQAPLAALCRQFAGTFRSMQPALPLLFVLPSPSTSVKGGVVPNQGLVFTKLALLAKLCTNRGDW